MDHDLAIPGPDSFRAWVCKTIETLGISAFRWSSGAGVAPNVLNKFIHGDQRDLCLKTANALVAEAQRVARQNGVQLPEIPAVPLPDDTFQEGS